MEIPVTHFLRLLFFWFLPLVGEAPEPATEVATPLSPPCNCTVTQGNFSAPLPFLSTSTSAVNFYSYGNPANASANTGLEMPETMLIMIHEDQNTGSTSLIVILDQVNDGTGGNVDITFSCLPNSAAVALSDDGGELAGSPPVITGNFNWAPCCTDGGVISGFGCGNTITINPTINSGINVFSLVYGTPANPIFVNMPNINCPITINCGGASCCAEAFEFSGTTQNATCTYSGDGSIDLTTDCAATPAFLWSNGASTEDIYGLDAGTYSVTITDANGCSQSASYVISANNPSPQPNVTGPAEFCSGDIVELGVTGFYSFYQWSTGSVAPSIFISDPGTYTVTVTNAAGCTGTASKTITQNPSPAPDITGPGGVCIFYDTITLDAGPGYTAYQWSTGSTSQTIDISQFGGYFVTVTNSFGCTGFDFVVVDPLPNPFPLITGPEGICPGNSITLDAGPGFNSYLWSTGAANQTVTTSVGGTYTVTVTDADNCIGMDSLHVTENPVDSILLFQTSCNPADTGVFIQTFTNQYGCDSLEILTVGYSESDSVFLFSQSCNPQDTGIFIQTFTNQYGCDSIEILTVSLNESDSVFLFSQSCNPQDTGIFIQTFTNQYGCDSIEVLTISLNESDSVFLFSQSCNPQDTGIFIQTFTNQYGCDSVEVLTTTLLPSDSLFLLEASCSPQDTGTVVQFLTNQFGCDSIVTTTTTLLPADTVQVFAQSCDPNNAGVTEEWFVNSFGCDSLVITNTEYILADTTYLTGTTCDPLAEGVFEELFTGNDGCDSLVITTVELLPSDTTWLEAFTCDINLAGQSEEFLSNQYGCDSLIITNTSYMPPDTTLIFSESCNPGEVGIFEEILVNSFGCDSFLITTVSLLPSDTTALFQTSCDPNQAGTEEVLLENQYGCDSLLVITTTFAPADSTHINTTTCDPAEAGVSVEILMSTDGCDSVVTTTTTLLPSDTVQVIAQTCDPANVGIFEDLLFNQYGCDSLVITTIELLPSDTTFLQAITCDTGQAGQTVEILPNQYGCDSLIITTMTFIPPDTTLLFSETCDPDEAGTVEVHLQNIFGCDSVVTTTTALLPSDTTIVQAFSCDPGQVGTTEVVMTNTYGCDSLIITNTAQLPIDTTWLFSESCSPMDTGLVVSQLSNQYGCDSLVIEMVSLLASDTTYLFFESCEPADTGSVVSTFTNQAGCDSVVVAVTNLSPPPSLTLTPSDFSGFGVSCTGAVDGSILVEANGAGPFSFAWSNGNSGNPNTGLAAGSYAVTVTDMNGCTAISSVTLNEPDPLNITFAVNQPDCFDENAGAVIVETSGGVPPYRYSLDGQNFQLENAFTNLSAGAYQITVLDAGDCESSEIILINVPLPVSVGLGEDRFIESGDGLILEAIVNVPFDSLASVVWSPLDSAECPTCLTQPVVPLFTTTYSISITAENGCTDEDTLTVFVDRKKHVYVPNAFSPNGDGANDVFRIFAKPGTVKKIKSFLVFNRWGETVFQYFNFQPNDPAYGWDGTYRGQQMDPAVFAWFAVIEFLDGKTKVFEGDVTLVR